MKDLSWLNLGGLGAGVLKSHFSIDDGNDFIAGLLEKSYYYK